METNRGTKSSLKDRGKSPTVWNAALEEWDNLPQESLNALVLGIPRRIQECLRVRRGLTRY
ncbi:hypothetical protein C0J52_09686 [Blattella germanica]|nr:hypothetical protein C0J52_09686 [Blattella germanica]